MLPCGLSLCSGGVSACSVDGIIFVSSKPPGTAGPEPIQSALENAAKIDEAFTSDVTVLPISLPAGRLIYSPIGLSDYDDVRSFSEAAAKGINRALKAGVKKPLLILPNDEPFKNAALVTLLGALEALYVPIQVREDVPEKERKVQNLSVWSENEKSLSDIIKQAEILESGRHVARDIGGGDPERMAAPNVEQYVRKIFEVEDSGVKVEVINDENILLKEYPLFAAVNRAASVIERHRGRIIYLRYEPQNGEVDRTLCLVGKGITYDTGGADIKANGIMAGMSRDKCGAAAVAGFMKIISLVKPKRVRIVGAMCLARNSVGENCYVADEVITARSKTRVRVGNTDAEGRMVMADVLCKLKEEAVKYQNVHLMTIATLTGHACLAVGPYSIVMDNSVAQRNKNAYKLQEASLEIGDPFEISVLRREDIAFHRGKGEGDDVHQCANAPSSRTDRGHQGPAGFLILASGLDKHGLASSAPLSYSHLDIAGSAGDLPREPTGAPVLALASAYIPDIFN